MNYPCKAALFSLAATAFAISACQQSEEVTETREEAAEVTSGPDAKPGIAADGGRLMLPVVAGRPAAAYFTLRNGGAQAVTLAAVHIEGAGKAEMHETTGGKMASMKTVEIAGGGTVSFEPGGKHVMAFDVSDALSSGGTTELTLTFADGDKISIPLTIETMGANAHAH